MALPLDDKAIRSLCGRFSYEDGEAIRRAGQVAFTSGRYAEGSTFEATVDGELIRVDRSRDEIKASCSCPDFHPDDLYCKHIAAVLLTVKARLDADEGLAEASAETAIASRLFKLFDNEPRRPTGVNPIYDAREPLNVAFVCRPMAFPDGINRFVIEMKIGLTRLYSVTNMREFLGQIERRRSCAIAKAFAYDPESHGFRREDDEIVRELIRIAESDAYHPQAEGREAGRSLAVPPPSWEELLPLLAESPSVVFEHGDQAYKGMQASDDSLPLAFAFGRPEGIASDGYELDVQGLERLTVMDAYGVVVADGKLLRPAAVDRKRVAELKRMFEGSGRHRLYLAPEQAEPFMDKVMPGLMRLGAVNVAREVSERLVRTPLKAKLYLDRIRDRLVAGLEFQYGDIVIDPLEARSRQPGEGRILLREGEQERRILELMEQSEFVRTEGGYFLADEDAEYRFLYQVVPLLQKLAEVHATSAVKTRLHVGNVHPKAKVDVEERTDWLEIKFEMDGIPESEIRDVLRSLEEQRNYHRLSDGAFLPLESPEFREMARLLGEMGTRKNDGTHARLPLVQGLRLIDHIPSGNAVSLGKSLRRLLENMRNPDHLEFPIPDRLEDTLRDYQKYGYQWLRTLARYRFGGVLADEMGLGKTIQGIAFLLSALPEIREAATPALILCPASVMYNWLNELKRFAPEIRAVIADGGREERSGALGDFSRADVIITSYPLLRRDKALYEALTFHTLILDEAQAFKNHYTQTAQAVKALNARHRFALTGTPMENSLDELWSIYDIVQPGLFPSKKEFAELSKEAVAKRIRPFLLRRLKGDVLKQLPEKIETLQASRLLPEQKKLYVAYLARLRQETVKHLDEEGFGRSRLKILAGITRLRQLCCHPALFVQDYAGRSAKFEQLLELAEEYRSAGKRLLVFSQFTEMLGMIGRELGYRGVPFFYLDGQTPASERVRLCDRFNAGERDVFLLSLKAGGTGLNLTGADTVVLYDLWWNPAVEQQAADRAHRIGQKNVVHVIRLVAEGTVEDKMYELQRRKMNLIDEVIRPGDDGLSAMTEDDVRELLFL